jgi:HEPN domain-containing protein
MVSSQDLEARRWAHIAALEQTLASLVEQLSRMPGVRKVMPFGSSRDTHCIPTRYPNGLPDDIPARVYNRASGESALSLATSVITQVETLLASITGRREASRETDVG